MFLLYFIYAIVLGIFLFLIFQSSFELLMIYIILFEMIYFITYKHFKIEYQGALRTGYIIALLIGYFSGQLLYGIDNYDPNIPTYFIN